MKSWAVNLLLALSAGTALCLFICKFKLVNSDADRVVSALSGLHNQVKGVSRISLKCDASGNDELPLYTTYAIAPLVTKAGPTSIDDTVLLVEPINITDTATLVLINNSIVIWQQQDDKFRYMLTHKK